MATPTTGTRTTKPARSPSADYYDAPLSYEELAVAYFDCRRTKRNTRNALAFEWHLERNLYQLYVDLIEGTYKPGPSICFVVTRPKAREVWAADFRDRIVHHVLYNRIGPRFENSFIADSCACITGRGTLYAAKRLESKIRSITENWSRPAYYLKLDLANFFVSIDKRILRDQLGRKISEPWWLRLTETVLFHDPRTDFEFRGDPALLDRVPPHKRLTNQPDYLGLPIGNLSSQFFANVYLDVLDQRAKHVLGARHYIRYVDDFLFLHESADWLNAVLADVDAFLPERLGARLNPAKTILQPVDRGVDFVGHVIKPWVRSTRRRTVNEAIRRVARVNEEDFLPVANSYFGLLGQAPSSHHDRARIAKVVRYRGHVVNRAFTQTYRTRVKQ
ncbi:MAG: reverse transcriptase domain-containing protein [Paraburkholderia fungorum]|nr:reverse transcriptase domain-containing protein [Paraburkholderia fungorum]